MTVPTSYPGLAAFAGFVALLVYLQKRLACEQLYEGVRIFGFW